MADRSIMTALAAGVRKSNDMSLVTDARALMGLVREPFSGAWQKNMELRPPTLVGYSPIYACVTRIASDIAKLSIDLVVTDEKGVQTLAPKTSPYWRVIRRPNRFQNRIQFVRHWVLQKLIHGNTYAFQGGFDERGICTDLYLLDSKATRPNETEEGDVYYTTSSNVLATLPNGASAIPKRLIIHDRCPTLFHPLVGIPPLVACALSGALGIAIQRRSALFFGNNARPSGIITGPNKIDPIDAIRLKTEWEGNYSGINAGRTAVLGNALKFEAMSETAEASQLAEQLGLSAIDVATAYGMPAYKLNQGPMPTNNNVQALQQQYYSDALQTVIEDLEICLTEGLGVPDGYAVQFNLDGLLRMDSATQMDVLAKGVGGAIMMPDEARAKLNLQPVPGGNAVYLQQQNYSLPALAKRDASADPFGKAAPVAAPAASAVAEVVDVAEKGIEAVVQVARDALAKEPAKAPDFEKTIADAETACRVEAERRIELERQIEDERHAEAERRAELERRHAQAVQDALRVVAEAAEAVKAAEALANKTVADAEAERRAEVERRAELEQGLETERRAEADRRAREEQRAVESWQALAARLNETTVPIDG